MSDIQVIYGRDAIVNIERLLKTIHSLEAENADLLGRIAQLEHHIDTLEEQLDRAVSP